MNTKLLLVFACGLAAVGVGPAAEAAKPSAQVTVIFEAPEKFTDARNEYMISNSGQERLLEEIKNHITSVAPKYLAPGQTLEIKVKDLDLAGDFEPWHGTDFDHIRILKEVYPPRMTLEFRLLDAAGKVVSEGTRSLQNPGYLMTTAMPHSDPLRYDKDMIRDWLRVEFKHAS